MVARLAAGSVTTDSFLLLEMLLTAADTWTSCGLAAEALQALRDQSKPSHARGVAGCASGTWMHRRPQPLRPQSTGEMRRALTERPEVHQCSNPTLVQSR